MRRVGVVLLVVLALGVAGCPDPDDDTAGETGGDSAGDGSTDDTSSPPLPSTTVTFEPAPDVCLNPYPSELGVWTDVEEEAPFINDVIACTDLGETWTKLTNRGFATWTLHSTPGGAEVVPYDDPGLIVSTYRSYAESRLGTAVLAPGASVIVKAPPDQVSWFLEKDASFSWLAYRQGIEIGVERLQRAALGSLTADSPVLGAAISCGLTAWEIVEARSDDTATSDPTAEFFEAVSAATGTGSCIAGWYQAADELERRFGVRLPFADDFARLARRATPILDDVDTGIPLLQGLLRAIRLSPRL